MPVTPNNWPNPDLMPLAHRLNVMPAYGDIHNHCNISYGHGNLADALARAAEQLDFVSITGHAHWPDMPVNEPSVAHIVDFHIKGFAKLIDGWSAHFGMLQKADKDGFVVFPGYEIHSNEHGDYTIIYHDLSVQPLHLANSPAELKEVLQNDLPGRAIAFPHHIGYRQGARGINWQTFDEDLSPFVEMLSMHGCAETSETDRSYLHSMGPVDGHSTMDWGLKQGHIFGIVGNTDHHSAFPGSYGHGRMAAYGRSKERDDIWQAMTDRHTNALTGDRIHLLAAINGSIQGSVIDPQEDAMLDIEALGGGFIETIDVIRNGQLFARVSPSLDPNPITPDPRLGTEQFETILHLELGWGARGRSHPWHGSLQLESGTILGLEPRFRGAEVVSPLEGDDAGHALPHAHLANGKMDFSVIAEANPNNMTSATQAMALHCSLSADSVIRAELCGITLEIPASRLLEGALSGNLGVIDTPAYRFHSLPLPHQWQWQGSLPLGAVKDGENLYLRLRQAGGQMAWTSPLYCRSGA